MSFTLESINVLDVVLCVILLLFSLRGLLCGLIQEITGFIALVGGVLLAGTYAARVSDYFVVYIGDGRWSYGLAYIGILVAMFFFMGLVNKFLPTFFEVRYAAWFNYLGGAVIGLIKGIVIASLLVMLMQEYFYDMSFVQTSYLVPYVVKVSYIFRDFLPYGMQMMYEYDGAIDG